MDKKEASSVSGEEGVIFVEEIVEGPTTDGEECGEIITIDDDDDDFSMNEQTPAILNMEEGSAIDEEEGRLISTIDDDEVIPSSSMDGEDAMEQFPIYDTGADQSFLIDEEARMVEESKNYYLSEDGTIQDYIATPEAYTPGDDTAWQRYMKQDPEELHCFTVGEVTDTQPLTNGAPQVYYLPSFDVTRCLAKKQFELKLGRKYFSQYSYIMRLAAMGKHLTPRQKTLNPYIPVFTLKWICKATTMPEESKQVLCCLDYCPPLATGFCKHLPNFHLIMMLLELPKTLSTWQCAIQMEILSRPPRFSWANGFCAGICLREGNHAKHYVETSPDFYNTRMHFAITFYNSSFSENVQYRVPRIKYTEAKTLHDYLLEDATIGLSIPTVTIGVHKLHFYVPPAAHDTSTIYTTLCFPQMDAVNWRYTTCMYEIGRLLTPEENVECLFVFTKGSNPYFEVTEFVNYVNMQNMEKVPILGAFGVTDIFTDESDVVDTIYMAITRKVTIWHHFSTLELALHDVPGSNDYYEAQIIDFKSRIQRHEEELCLNFVNEKNPNKDEEWVILTQHLNCPIMRCEIIGIIDVFRRWGKYTLNITNNFQSAILYIGWGDLKESH